MDNATRRNLGRRHWIVFAGALGAFVVLTLLVLTVNTGSESASAAGSGPEMTLNLAYGGTCDDPVQPTACEVPTGGTFALTVNAKVIPASGYVGVTSLLDYGPSLTYLGASSAIWPDCDIATFLVGGAPPLMTHGCLTGFIPPLPVSLFAGPLFEISFACSTASSTTALELLVSNPGGIGGTRFVDADQIEVVPKLLPLALNCGPAIPPQPYPGDTDGDGCADQNELGPDETLGGRRDYLNPWDFYDVAGGGGGPPDGIIDLPNDVLGVIQHFSYFVMPPYDIAFDRGPSSGPNPWNMTAPDNAIDIPNDILGVILQHGHSCQQSP